MKKEISVVKSFRIKPSVIKLLNKLAKSQNRKPPNMLEELIIQAAKKEGLLK